MSKQSQVDCLLGKPDVGFDNQLVEHQWSITYLMRVDAQTGLFKHGGLEKLVPTVEAKKVKIASMDTRRIPRSPS